MYCRLWSLHPSALNSSLGQEHAVLITAALREGRCRVMEGWHGCLALEAQTLHCYSCVPSWRIFTLGACISLPESDSKTGICLTGLWGSTDICACEALPWTGSPESLCFIHSFMRARSFMISSLCPSYSSLSTFLLTVLSLYFRMRPRIITSSWKENSTWNWKGIVLNLPRPRDRVTMFTSCPSIRIVS